MGSSPTFGTINEIIFFRLQWGPLGRPPRPCSWWPSEPASPDYNRIPTGPRHSHQKLAPCNCSRSNFAPRHTSSLIRELSLDGEPLPAGLAPGPIPCRSGEQGDNDDIHDIHILFTDPAPGPESILLRFHSVGSRPGSIPGKHHAGGRAIAGGGWAAAIHYCDGSQGLAERTARRGRNEFLRRCQTGVGRTPLQVAATTAVRINVFNASRQKVRTLVEGEFNAGGYRIAWDGRGRSGRPLASEVYFLRMTAGEFSATRSVSLLK